MPVAPSVVRTINQTFVYGPSSSLRQAFNLIFNDVINAERFLQQCRETRRATRTRGARMRRRRKKNDTILMRRRGPASIWLSSRVRTIILYTGNIKQCITIKSVPFVLFYFYSPTKRAFARCDSYDIRVVLVRRVDKNGIFPTARRP